MQVDDTRTKSGAGQTVKKGSKQMGAGIGISVATVIAWVLEQYGGVEMPAPVVASVAGMIGAIGGWLSDK